MTTQGTGSQHPFFRKPVFPEPCRELAPRVSKPKREKRPVQPSGSRHPWFTFHHGR